MSTNTAPTTNTTPTASVWFVSNRTAVVYAIEREISRNIRAWTLYISYVFVINCIIIIIIVSTISESTTVMHHNEYKMSRIQCRNVVLKECKILRPQLSEAKIKISRKQQGDMQKLEIFKKNAIGDCIRYRASHIVHTFCDNTQQSWMIYISK